MRGKTFGSLSDHPVTDAAITAYGFDMFRLDLPRAVLRGPDGAELRLRPKAFALLQHLLDNAGQLIGREDLLDALWPGLSVTDDSLTQCVSEIRQALGDRAGHVLRTVPRRGYVLLAAVTPLAEAGPAAPGPAPAPMPVGAQVPDPLLMLHPLGSAGGEESARAAAVLDGELLTDITRHGELRVVDAGNGQEGYSLRGEVLLLGDRLRVSVRLAQAADSDALWAERFQHPWPDPVAIETLSGRLAGSLARQIEREELRRARRSPPEALSARQLCLIGRDHYHRGTEADTRAAGALFERAMAIEPDHAPAYAWQAYVAQRAITHGWGASGGEEARQRLLVLARTAVQLAPDLPLALARLAFSLVMHRRWEEAVETARAALRTGRPRGYITRTSCGEVLTAAGHPEEAVETLRQALAADPFCPPATRAVLGRALLLSGRPEAALPELRWCAARLPDYAPCFHSLVVAAAETDSLEEARRALAEVVRLQPGWRPRNHTGHWYFRMPGDVDRFTAAFRAAGMPEADARAPAPAGSAFQRPARQRA